MQGVNPCDTKKLIDQQVKQLEEKLQSFRRDLNQLKFDFIKLGKY